MEIHYIEECFHGSVLRIERHPRQGVCRLHIEHNPLADLALVELDVAAQNAHGRATATLTIRECGNMARFLREAARLLEME